MSNIIIPSIPLSHYRSNSRNVLMSFIFKPNLNSLKHSLFLFVIFHYKSNTTPIAEQVQQKYLTIAAHSPLPPPRDKGTSSLPRQRLTSKTRTLQNQDGVNITTLAPFRFTRFYTLICCYMICFQMQHAVGLHIFDQLGKYADFDSSELG